MKTTPASPGLFHSPGDSPAVVPGEHSLAHVADHGGVQPTRAFAKTHAREHPPLARRPRAHLQAKHELLLTTMIERVKSRALPTRAARRDEQPPTHSAAPPALDDCLRRPDLGAERAREVFSFQDKEQCGVNAAARPFWERGAASGRSHVSGPLVVRSPQFGDGRRSRPRTRRGYRKKADRPRGR
jgi:hypothetical protein